MHPFPIIHGHHCMYRGHTFDSERAEVYFGIASTYTYRIQVFKPFVSTAWKLLLCVCVCDFCCLDVASQIFSLEFAPQMAAKI